MIRTDVVNLTVIPAAAYRQKLTSGGSGIVIVRGDVSQPGIASISKTSGDAIPSANTPAEFYPQEAFKEAIALTAGMPYKRQGSVQFKNEKISEDEKEDSVEQKEEEAVVDSGEYEKLVAAYTDKSGRISYDLINRDLIKFSHSSSVVRKMISECESVEAIRLYAVGTKFKNITGNNKLSDAQVLKLAELLDEVSPKGVFKEFNDELRTKLKAAKKK